MAGEKKQNLVEIEYIIPLREKLRSVPRYKKTNKAVKTVKEFLARHMKVYGRDLNKIKIDKYLNEYLWFRGIRKPPYKVKVKARKEGEIVRVELVELPEKLKFKKAREEKREANAKKLEKKKPELEKQAEKTEVKEEIKEFEDKNKDGIDDKKEEVEKKSALVESGEKFEKTEHKKQKHTTREKMPTQKIQSEKTPKQNY